MSIQINPEQNEKLEKEIERLKDLGDRISMIPQNLSNRPMIFSIR
jgi:hypothetical protein